jgi:potassium-transporting ATPase KdpC subunit
MSAIIRPAVVLFALLTLLTGIIYPLLVTGIAEVAFADQSRGSLILKEGKLVGSRLIGQSFAEPKYFWSRPSATSPQPYNGTASSGSNLGPLNPALTDAVKTRIQALQAADPDNKEPVPVDLVTASASGLDPHISVAAAQYQMARIARVRNLDVWTVQALVAAHTQDRLGGIFGEPRVDVLELNLALDDLRARRASSAAR